MRILLLAFALLSSSLFAQERSFRNDREGTSYYSGNSYNRAINEALKDFDHDELMTSYRTSLSATPDLCVYSLNEKIKTNLAKINPRSTDYVGVVYFLRHYNEIDDVAAGILLKAHKVVTTVIYDKQSDKLASPGPSKDLKSYLDLVAGFEKRLQTSCFDQAYQGLFADLKKKDKNYSSKNLEALLYTAKTRRLISEAIYVRLEQARDNELESGALTLKDYAQKLKILRTQFPLRDSSERSNFVATKASKVKMSYRQRLFENYNEVQIALMAKMITDLRRRLESKSISIVIENKDQTIETIPLEPMERFRFSIKKLRSEMTRLSLSSQFSGRSPDYMDLISASYEIGFIAGSELEQLASLEEIWNPKKSFWDKAKVWFQTFSSVASVVIPPPYGFIPTLVLVVIEATVNKDDPNPEDHGSIF